MTMHIERVEVSDFKRLKAVDIEVKGNVVTIGGNNAQGKSSFLDAIWNTLGGKQKAIEEPIRQGQSKASSTITLVDENGEGLVATRTWKGERSTVTVKVKGTKTPLAEPQKVLDKIIGPFAFDPMAFATMKDKDRRDALVKLIGIDVSVFDAEDKRLRDERVLIGRDVKRVKGALEEAQQPASGLPTEFVSVTALSEQINRHENVVSQMAVFRRRSDEIAAEIEKLRAEAKECDDKLFKGAAWVESQPDLAVLKDRFANAEATNQSIHAAAEYRRLKTEHDGYDKTYDELTGQIEANEAAKVAALADANLPLEGLTFDDESVYYNGVPFSQASSAERIRVSVAMAVAHNPDLRVVTVKDASLMDEQSLALLKEIAAEHGVQLFLEMVGTGDYTVVLEDGEVVS